MKRWILAIAFIFGLSLSNILLSREPEPPNDGVGGGGSGRLLGYWSTYSQRQQKITCYEYAISNRGVEIRIKEGWILWITERCYRGGNECNPGAQREKFGGMIC